MVCVYRKTKMAEGSHSVNTEKQDELNTPVHGSLQDNQPLEAPGVPRITVSANQNESRLNVFRYIAGLKDKEQDKGVSACDVIPHSSNTCGGSALLTSPSGGSTWTGNSSSDPRFSYGAGLNMAAPNDNNMNQTMFVLQEQLKQTHSMCIQQQRSLDKLTAAVTSLTNQRNSGDNDDRSEYVSNYDQISSEENLSDSESEGDSEIREEPVKKKLKQDTITHSDRKLAKLKAVESTFIKQEECGPSVHDVIASTVNNGLSSIVDHKAPEVQELVEKYKRPENCEYLQVPRVNKIIWSNKQVKKELKAGDKQLQRTQQYVTSGMIPLVKIMNKTLDMKSEEAEEIFDLALDTYNLFALAHSDMSSQRRRLLTPAISSKYATLCSGKEKFSSPTHLFGNENDLEKKLKEIDENRKLCDNLGVTGPKHQSHGNTKWTSNVHSKAPKFRHGPSQNFLGKRPPPPHNWHHRKGQQKRADQGHKRK